MYRSFTPKCCFIFPCTYGSLFLPLSIAEGTFSLRVSFIPSLFQVTFIHPLEFSFLKHINMRVMHVSVSTLPLLSRLLYAASQFLHPVIFCAEKYLQNRCPFSIRFLTKFMFKVFFFYMKRPYLWNNIIDKSQLYVSGIVE